MSFLRGVVYFTVFTSSLAIMFLQLISGRIVAPYLGQNLFTWSGIIATTLAGIAIGNYVGGRIADRFKPLNSIPIQFFVVALVILLILPINIFLGDAYYLRNMSWELRIFVHIFTLFIPSFICLGTVSPVLTRFLLTITQKEGVSLGIFYFSSLVGSLVGTFLTGFYLISAVSYYILITISIILLLMISCGYLILRFIPDVLGRLPSSQAVENFGRDEPTRREKIPFGYLLIASFWAGAGIMIVEIVGGRILAKNFGNSLYTWTSNIGVILAGLSIGGYIGGSLSDRFDNRRLLSFLLFASSLSVILIPLASVLIPVLPLLWNFSWSQQILLFTCIVFGPASIFFGALPPILVRFTSGSSQIERGRRIGKLYAMNAVGGVLGVLLTAYYLIVNLGSPLTLAIVSMISALFYLWFSRRSLYSCLYSILVILIVLSAFAPGYPLDSLALQLAIKPYRPENIVYEKESHYNYILVKRADPDRPYILDLVLDKMIHNRRNLREPFKLLGAHEFIFDSLVSYYDKRCAQLRRGLVLGGGAYTFCHYLEHTYPYAQFEVAEIDKEVTNTAFMFFGLPKDTRLHIYNQDARNRVDDILKNKGHNSNFQQYDFVINDSFSDYTVPFHLTTIEFVKKIGEILSPKGVYMCNIIDCISVGKLLSAMIKTCESVFPYQYVFRTTKEANVRDTMILVASRVEIDPHEIIDFVKEKYKYEIFSLTEYEIQQLIKDSAPPLLTDSFAPVENLLAPMVALTEETPYLRKLGAIARKMERQTDYYPINDIMDIIQKKPNLSDAYILLLEALYREGRFQEVVAWSKVVINKAPRLVRGYVYLGSAYVKLGNIDSAIEAWEKALELDPHVENLRVNLSSLYIQKNEIDKAEKVLSGWDSFIPKVKVSALINLASIKYIQGDYDNALEYLLEAEKLEPQNYDVKKEIAVVYLKLGEKDKARKKVMECLNHNVSVSAEILRELEINSN